MNQIKMVFEGSKTLKHLFFKEHFWDNRKCIFYFEQIEKVFLKHGI